MANDGRLSGVVATHEFDPAAKAGSSGTVVVHEFDTLEKAALAGEVVVHEFDTLAAAALSGEAVVHEYSTLPMVGMSGMFQTMEYEPGPFRGGTLAGTCVVFEYDPGIDPNAGSGVKGPMMQGYAVLMGQMQGRRLARGGM